MSALRKLSTIMVACVALLVLASTASAQAVTVLAQCNANPPPPPGGIQMYTVKQTGTYRNYPRTGSPHNLHSLRHHSRAQASWVSPR